MNPSNGIGDTSRSRRGPSFPIFGEPPFDDVGTDNPLFGTRVLSVPEHALIHAAAIGLLPEWNRYLSHLAGQGNDSDDLASFASSGLRRFARTILLNERARQLVSHPPSIDTGDELLDIVTLSFVHSMGAFDAFAQVAAGVIGVQGKGQTIAWQNPAFLKAVADRTPALAAIFSAGTEGKRALDAIRAVRNTIHKQMPNPTQMHRDAGDPAHDHISILFEGDTHEELLGALDAVGWSRFVPPSETNLGQLYRESRVDIAGVVRVNGALFIRPLNLLAGGFREAVPLLNRILAATPVETLGPPVTLLSPAMSLYPLSLQQHAVEKFGLSHLARLPGMLPRTGAR